LREEKEGEEKSVALRCFAAFEFSLICSKKKKKKRGEREGMGNLVQHETTLVTISWGKRKERKGKMHPEIARAHASMERRRRKEGPMDACAPAISFRKGEKERGSL